MWGERQVCVGELPGGCLVCGVLYARYTLALLVLLGDAGELATPLTVDLVAEAGVIALQVGSGI